VIDAYTEQTAHAGLDGGTEADMLEVVLKNRKAYTDRHGYALVDGSQYSGTERPKSWYKLKAVEAALDDYDWVFWLDADAWITNPDVALESILPSSDGVDLVVTRDATGANAGAWMLRNSDWSRLLLAQWWGMTSYIRVCAPGHVLQYVHE
jgi:hypothetical protein